MKIFIFLTLFMPLVSFAGDIENAFNKSQQSLDSREDLGLRAISETLVSYDKNYEIIDYEETVPESIIYVATKGMGACRIDIQRNIRDTRYNFCTDFEERALVTCPQGKAFKKLNLSVSLKGEKRLKFKDYCISNVPVEYQKFELVSVEKSKVNKVISAE
jgi:hypothetical protein